MRLYENFILVKIKVFFEIYWNCLEDWFCWCWLGLVLFVIVGWLVMYKDIFINFFMEKGEGGFFMIFSILFFYDFFEDDVV